MSIKNWPGGVVRATPVTPSGPYQNSSASGIWTLDQQAYWDNQNLWPTAGNLDPSLFIENIFSTYLYTGTGSSQTITNNIDTTTYGGLVWIKGRSGATGHRLTDTARGTTKSLESNGTAAEATESTGLTAFGTTGFTIGADADYNTNTATYASWTFRKQPKFFDVVTYTGNGTAGRTVSHNLGSTPGVIIVKRTDGATNWRVYHRSLGATQYLDLDETVAAGTATTIWNDTSPTSTVFSVGTNSGVNASGGTYVAYLFAHDAGGFGAAGSDNVISCGTFTTDGSGNATVTLNYELQWVMTKRTDTTGVWSMFDTMRGMPLVGSNQLVEAQSNAAETAGGQSLKPTATGFSVTGSNASATFVYIAIRRGPMRTPTSGTSVFVPTKVSGSSLTKTYSIGFPTDLFIGKDTLSDTYQTWVWQTRLTKDAAMSSASTSAESIGAWGDDGVKWDRQNSIYIESTGYLDNSPILYTFRRAPGFFDVVCYTGTGSATTITHNLASVPELMIVKTRSTVDFWYVYHKDVGNTKYLQLQSTAAPATSSVVWNNTTPTSSVFSVGVATNGSGVTHVAYLFSTVTGVSKVGSYTGTGTTSVKQVDCGFTGGARFVLIKRTDSTGDWYIWDSARGIVAGNDPYLLLNSTAAEVTTTDWVDTYSLGFELSTASGNNVNINNATYIFLAIA